MLLIFKDIFELLNSMHIYNYINFNIISIYFFSFDLNSIFLFNLNYKGVFFEFNKKKPYIQKNIKKFKENPQTLDDFENNLIFEKMEIYENEKEVSLERNK